MKDTDIREAVKKSVLNQLQLIQDAGDYLSQNMAKNGVSYDHPMMIQSLTNSLAELLKAIPGLEILDRN